MSFLAIENLIEGKIDVISTSILQILGDIGCWIFATKLFLSKKTQKNLKLFYLFVIISFVAMTIDDIYYNYMYRIMHFNIRNSTGLLVTLTFVLFQLSQVYSWLMFILRQKIKIISQQNIPYLLCSSFVICILIYFFYSSQNYSIVTIGTQSIEVLIDMCIWLFAIICFANTTSRTISLLTFGSLLIISADLTTRCLYIFEPEELAYTMWVHILWTLGVVVIFYGLVSSAKYDNFTFASKDSLQVTSSSQIVLISFISFSLGVVFLTLFHMNEEINMHSMLWGLPVVLMFVLIISISLAKKFSTFLVSPINQILYRVNLFDSGKKPEKNVCDTEIYEFNILSNFIDSTMEKLSVQLDKELKISAQVAHDIRSPLSALQILTEQKLTELEESKRILLRDAVYQMRDIVNNLDQNSFSKSTETQIAVLLDHVLSERRTSLLEKSIVINQNFDVYSYNLFTKISPSDIKCVFTNLINNSIEAISSGFGIVDVLLGNDEHNIIIKISDNGPGVAQNSIASLFKRGFTTKKEGSGLGLYHARETILQSGGSIDLESYPNKGVTITIKLPSQNPPAWFATQLKISNHSTVICVDDSVSIWNAWQERLKSVKGNVDLTYCSDKISLLRELGKTDDHRAKTYLVDYEFSGCSYTGLNLIQKILLYKKNSDQVFLVTSRSDIEIQDFCLENNLKLISKFFALKIPVEIF